MIVGGFYNHGSNNIHTPSWKGPQRCYRVQGLGRNILPILVDLAMVAHSHMLDAVTFHNEPIIASSMQAFMHHFHQVGGIYALKQSYIVVPLIQDFPTQKELACHVPDKLLLIVQGSGQIFTILDISLDIMVPWLSVNLHFNIHAFFDVHAIG